MTVVLDANVLEDMLNPAINRDEFITEMVSSIFDKGFLLGLDEGRRIDKEYFSRLGQWISNANETVNRQLLQMFIGADQVSYPYVKRIGVEKDALLVCIQRQMPDTPKKKRSKDRVYVYVAARLGAALVTADAKDILKVEARLKKCAKTHARTELEIFDLHSAKAWLDKQ